MDRLRLNTLRGTKPAFLNPKTIEENPPPFLNGNPPLRRVHRRTGNFLPGGAVIHLPKKLLQVAQIFTKQSKGN